MKKYLSVKTNSLVTLAGRKNNKIDWEAMGTTVTSIQLDSIMTSENVDGELNYIIPIVDEGKAHEFKLKAEQLGVVVEIVEEEKAKEKKESVNSKKVKKADESAERERLIDQMLVDLGYKTVKKEG